MTDTPDYDKTAEPEAHASSHESGGSDEIDIPATAPLPHASTHNPGGNDIISHPYTPPAVNDFSGDPNCVALWRFEHGALTVDSIGGNTLTNNAGVVSNRVDFKEGSASADLEAASGQFFDIIDADLDAGFPLKSDDENKKISVCGWFQMESQTEFGRGLFSKYNTGDNKRSLMIRVMLDSFQVYIGHNNGESSEVLYDGSTLQVGGFYHYGFTFQDSDKSWKLVVWDDTGQTKIIDTSGVATNNINVGDEAVLIGMSYMNIAQPSGNYDGEMDEKVVFKDILTTDEIDEIRLGTYSP